MSSSRVVLARLLASAALLPACFDVSEVDPEAQGEFVVDDFDEGSGAPALPFERWRCVGFNNLDDHEAVKACDFGPDDHGGLAAFGEFLLSDPPNGVQEFSGGGLRTDASRPIDLRSFREMAFSARFVNGSMPVPSGTKYYAELGCSSAPAASDVSIAFYVNISVLLDSTWHRYNIPLQDFGQPSWESARIKGGTSVCLGLVDGIRWTVSSNLADGEAGGGTLYLDEVYFE